jgi:hypothetical protein
MVFSSSITYLRKVWTTVLMSSGYLIQALNVLALEKMSETSLIDAPAPLNSLFPSFVMIM